VCTLVNAAIEKVGPLARARNVEIIHKFHCADAPVAVDRRLFTIALMHLIENALTYTLTPGSVNIAITKGDKNVRIIIQDRGIGISPEDAAIIFQPFARGERAGKHDPDGIGVGLTVARLIVRDFKGRLTWQNRDRGMGAQFEMILSLAKK
jgi:signal transduction histidine kinase